MASRTRRFFLNALSLTGTALIMRGVGMAFGIYISNYAGSETMGLYSLISSVYGFAVTFGCAGINLGTTRLVSEALGKKDPALARQSAKTAIRVCALTGGAASLILFFTSSFIGTHILGDLRSVSSLQILSFSLFPVAICSCLSGYFTAVRHVKINAVFQVLIQFCKIGMTVYLLSEFVSKGTEQACIALVLGSTLSELLSLLLTYTLYRIDIRRSKMPTQPVKKHKIVKDLLTITLPVTFSACIRSALTMVQHVLVPQGLKACGKSWQEALSSYGALHGMALPVVLFPSAFISSFAGLFIPEISECCAMMDRGRLKRVSYRALTLSLFFSIGVSGIMAFYSHELGILIYGNKETSRYIRILAPLIPVMYIDSTVDAILKGSGHQVYSMNVNIADALTSCILALTLIPKFGIWGYIISIYATELLNTTLSLYKMLSVSAMHPKLIHQVILPILCIIGATNISGLLLRWTEQDMLTIPSLILGMLLTVGLYILLLFATGGLGKEEGEVLRASLLSEKQYNRKYKTSAA